MAATGAFWSVVFTIFIVYNFNFSHFKTYTKHYKRRERFLKHFQATLPLYVGSFGHKVISVQPNTHTAQVCLAKNGFLSTRFSLSKWTKHGYTALAIAGHDPPTNITIYMDVSVNLGPTSP